MRPHGEGRRNRSLSQQTATPCHEWKAKWPVRLQCRGGKAALSWKIFPFPQKHMSIVCLKVEK